jgi:hypothetical protein
MPGRRFLDVARDVLVGATEYHWRASVIHAYYALMLEARDTLAVWGFSAPKRQNVHHWVRLRFSFSSGPELRKVGQALDDLCRERNAASYDLRSTRFRTPAPGTRAIQKASTTLARLDHICADPARRAAAIAAIRP